MSNDVQSHEEVGDPEAGAERRRAARHAARSLGSVTARIIGGSQVELVNFSNRGVLFECDSRLLIGARASVRITTSDANLLVTGRVVRSRVKGLVNGALRYDAALVLDNELTLTPAIAHVVPSLAGDMALESDLDSTVDPSPVEAYVAESEASLLEVAPEADLSLRASAPEIVDAATPLHEPPPLMPEPPALENNRPVVAADEVAMEAAALDAGTHPPEPVTVETEDVAFEPEGVAFEADAEIAFEPAAEFAFDEGVTPADVLVAAPPSLDESGGTSTFDATYIPPVYETSSGESQFEVTVPVAVQAEASSSFFDSRPSDHYGESATAPVEETAATDLLVAPADAVVADADIAFEPEDPVSFEPSFDAVPVDPLPDVDELSTGLAEPAIDAAGDDLMEPHAAVPDTEDRVLLQFAATVPHDLAELRRIAADNQW